MSQYYATIHAYDVIDQVHVTALVWSTREAPEDTTEVLYRTATTFPGTGEQDAREWLKDALVAALEGY